MTNKNLKHNYFDSINSNNAYWAGFIATDSCVSKRDNLVTFTLSSIDKEDLIKLKKRYKSRFIFKNLQAYFCKIRMNSNVGIIKNKFKICQKSHKF
jgi:hypothetical protein